jgi:hypothetical protein
MSGKHISVAMNKHTTMEELLEAVFSVWSKPTIYNGDQQQPLESPILEGE